MAKHKFNFNPLTGILDICDTNYYTPSATDNITALAGQGTVNLTAHTNRISVCATADNAVTLPATFPVDYFISIRNDGAERALVYPASTDSLGLGADVPVQLLSGQAINLKSLVANTTWIMIS